MPSDHLVRNALMLAQKGGKENWQAAHKNIERCIKRGQNNVNLIIFYIICLEKIENSKEALSVAIRMVDRNSDHFLLNYLLGKMLCEKGEFVKALYYLRNCSSIRPQHTGTLILMTQCSEKLNLKLTQSIYKRILEFESYQNSFLAHNGLGVSYALEGELPMAMSLFSKALKLSDGNPQIYLNMAILADKYMKKPQVAKRFYEHFLEKADNNLQPKVEIVLARLKEIEI